MVKLSRIRRGLIAPWPGNFMKENNMTGSRLGLFASPLALVAVVAASPPQVRAETLHAHLAGYEEVVAVSTTGEGRFKAHLDKRGEAIDFELSYDELEGTVTQAHIHFGQRGVNGGISVFLCTNLGNSTIPVPACPPPPATIAGTIRPSDVIGPEGQGIEPGAFDELVAAIREGTAYANVHSTKWPGGEIRGQLR